MNSQKPTSLQAILKRRQQESFVGREEQIILFRQNLSLDLNDDQRRFIFNVFGQGGVGKTSLLRRFCQYAEETHAVTAWTDENDEDVSAIMAHLAEQLAQNDQTFKTFNERYRVYRQRRHELEADPEAPLNSPAFVGRILAKTGVHLGRRIPFAGAVLDCVDEDAFANQVSEWATYMTRKIANKDEVHLVQEPIEVLTPLLIEGLRKVAEKHLIALFFDTYERSGEYLDEWLRNFLEGHYGDVPPNIILVIAGRYELDRNRWAAYKDLLSRLPVESFSEKEALAYLTRKGITDKRVIDVILHLSGRLPLLVATLASESPREPDQVGDPSGTAVDRFLKWVEDPKQREVALDAALPRRFNRDILADLVGENDCDALFTWLKQMPFVEKHVDGWVYHDVVRAQMLRYKHQDTPQGWTTLHHRLVDYYEKLKDNLGLSEKQSQSDVTWQSLSLEELYHQLCQEPHKQLPAALNGFLARFDTNRAFARRWAEVVLQAGEDTAFAETQYWGKLLINGMKAFDESRYESAVELFTALLNRSDIEARGYKRALEWRARLYLWAEKYSKALPEITEILRLAPESERAWVERGYTYYKMKQYKEAIKDFTHALELKPNDARAIVLQGRVYEDMKQYEKALINFTRAVELRPQSSHELGHRGQIYGKLHQFEPALTDFTRAIELDPNNDWAFSGRSMTYMLMGHYDKALSDITRAIELDPNDPGELLNRGKLYKLLKRYEDALKDFEHALELNPGLEHQVQASRGESLQCLQRYEEAIDAFFKALVAHPACTRCWTKLAETYKALDPQSDIPKRLRETPVPKSNEPSVISCRAEAMRNLGYHEEALAEFDLILAQDESAISYIGNARGLTLTYLERYAEAIVSYEQALKQLPHNYNLLYNIAIAMARCNGPIEAQAQIDAARTAILAMMDTRRGAALYGLGGLEALSGNRDKALDYLQQAVSIENKAAEWARDDAAWLDLHTDSRFNEIISEMQLT